MGRGLIGDDVEAFAGGGPHRLDLGGIADQGDRQRPAVRGSSAGLAQGLLGIPRESIHVADLVATGRPSLVDLDGEADALVHRHGKRLGTAHPPEAGGQRDPPT